jgi:hypothetical protein
MYQREGEREHAGAGERLDATNKRADGWVEMKTLFTSHPDE